MNTEPRYPPSWWLGKPPVGFTDEALKRLPEMLKGPFGNMRPMQRQDEPWPRPKSERN